MHRLPATVAMFPMVVRSIPYHYANPVSGRTRVPPLPSDRRTDATLSPCRPPAWRQRVAGVRTDAPEITPVPGLALLLASSLVSAQQAAPAAPAAPPAGRTPGGGITQERMDELAQKHDGYYGALAPQNLTKPRPKPPFDLTGTWFVDLRRSFADFRFGPPYPEFYEPGQTALREAEEARKKGVPYRDVIGQCFPAGMPMIMTRVWPISMIQLPTAVYMLFGFTNSMRFIYLDGRKFTDPDTVVVHLQRRVDRPLGRRRAGRADEVLRAERALHRLGHSDQRPVRDDRAHHAVEGRHDAARSTTR